MRLYHKPMSSDLAILNAEQFLGTADMHLARKTSKVKKAHPAHADDGPRKRPKRAAVTVTRVDEEDDADEKSTRARGRPRLDTTDQTAADVGACLFIQPFTAYILLISCQVALALLPVTKFSSRTNCFSSPHVCTAISLLREHS